MPGNENIIVEESKNLFELVIFVRRADIKIWRTEKLSVSFPACLELTDCIQWSKKEFSVFAFGYHDGQNRNASNDMIHLETGQKKGKDV